MESKNERAPSSPPRRTASGELGIFKTSRPIKEEKKFVQSDGPEKIREEVVHATKKEQEVREMECPPRKPARSLLPDKSTSPPGVALLPAASPSSDKCSPCPSSPPSQLLLLRRPRELTCSSTTTATIAAKPMAKAAAARTLVAAKERSCLKASASLSINLFDSDTTDKSISVEKTAVEERKESKSTPPSTANERKESKSTPPSSANDSQICRVELALQATRAEVDELEREVERRLAAMTLSTHNDHSATPPRETVVPLSILQAAKAIERGVSVSPPCLVKGSSLPSSGMEGTRVSGSSKTAARLAARVREGLADFTAGSTDRLQKWKSKLHATGKRSSREKDASAPPPFSRSSAVPSKSPEVVVDWSVRPRPLHITRSASNAITLPDSTGMEHRTLKSTADVLVPSSHNHNVHSFRRNSNRPSFSEEKRKDSMELPPPVRLVPFSGARVHTVQLSSEMAPEPTNPPMFTSADMNTLLSALYPPRRPLENGHEIIRPIACRAEGAEMASRGSAFQNKLDYTKSAMNLSASCCSSSSGLRPRQLLTSSSFTASGSMQPQPRQENEYDSVPDIFSEAPPHSARSHECKPNTSGGSSGSSSLSQRCLKGNGAGGGRSAALHITPSPSDSGIVDYETIIRDKENELRDVRTTMEQNEEIIVKVYLEKEKTWKEQLENLRQRLAASEKGETALRMQLGSVSRQNEALNAQLAQLRQEKNALQQALSEKSSPECAECGRQSVARPVPAPRHLSNGVKELPKAPASADSSLREDVSELRREIATLKEALHHALPSTNKNGDGRDRLI